MFFTKTPTLAKQAGVVEAVLNRAGQKLCRGRKRPAHGCKLVNFVNVANFVAFVAIQSVLKMVAPLTLLKSGNYAGIRWLNFRGRVGLKGLNLNVGQLQVVHNVGWRIVNQEEDLPALNQSTCQMFSRLTGQSLDTRFQKYLHSFVNSEKPFLKKSCPVIHACTLCL